MLALDCRISISLRLEILHLSYFLVSHLDYFQMVRTTVGTHRERRILPRTHLILEN